MLLASIDAPTLLTGGAAVVTALVGTYGMVVRERGRHAEGIKKERTARQESEGALLTTVTRITDDLVKDLYAEIARLRDAREKDRRDCEKEMLVLRVRVESMDAVNTRFLSILKALDRPISDTTLRPLDPNQGATP